MFPKFELKEGTIDPKNLKLMEIKDNKKYTNLFGNIS